MICDESPDRGVRDGDAEGEFQCVQEPDPLFVWSVVEHTVWVDVVDDVDRTVLVKGCPVAVRGGRPWVILDAVQPLGRYGFLN